MSSALRQVKVPLAGGGYSVWIGRDVARRWRFEEPTRAFVVFDRAVAPVARRLARDLRARGWAVDAIPVTAGEKLKDLASLLPIYSRLIEGGADRRSVVFAVGGGVVGDAVGFVAATYLRGVRWVGVPTTLLAQVDSAIGGKTAVNHPLGKNLIGAFHQPSAVLCDLSLLRSLPERERLSGLGEIVKYGLAQDAAFFAWLERNWERVLRGEPEATLKAVSRCAELKAGVVASDERETLGKRDVLNFGHTIGHAIEAATGFGRYRHGEAVLLGMRFAVALSMIRGHLPAAQAARAQQLLGRIAVPALPKGLGADRLIALTRRDKKAQAGRVRYVLLRRIGATALDREVTDAEVRQALAASLLPPRPGRKR